jgi:hypothetical protein
MQQMALLHAPKNCTQSDELLRRYFTRERARPGGIVPHGVPGSRLLVGHEFLLSAAARNVFQNLKERFHHLIYLLN